MILRPLQDHARYFRHNRNSSVLPGTHEVLHVIHREILLRQLGQGLFVSLLSRHDLLEVRHPLFRQSTRLLLLDQTFKNMDAVEPRRLRMDRHVGKQLGFVKPLELWGPVLLNIFLYYWMMRFLLGILLNWFKRHRMLLVKIIGAHSAFNFHDIVELWLPLRAFGVQQLLFARRRQPVTGFGCWGLCLRRVIVVQEQLHLGHVGVDRDQLDFLLNRWLLLIAIDVMLSHLLQARYLELEHWRKLNLHPMLWLCHFLFLLFMTVTSSRGFGVLGLCQHSPQVLVLEHITVIKT